MTLSSRLTSSASPTAGATGQPPAPILVVDDNPSKLLAVHAILAPLGYRIVEADSGLAALRRVSAENFAVILMDVRMPIMDGFETAALIRMRAQSEMTPIIFITAQATDEIVPTDRYAQGAVDFITAPVQPEELRAKVSAFANLFVRAEELAAAAKEVQASVDHLRLLTESAPIGIFQTDADNRYVYTNPRWAEITGVPSAQAVGQKWDVIIVEEQRPPLQARISGDAVDGEEFSHRFDLRASEEHTTVALLTSKAMQNDEGAITGWVGTLMDVTTSAQAESALARARDDAADASRMKSDFLANMSHEIRTPMNAVIGMTDLLIDTVLDPEQVEFLNTVRSSSDALMAVINDILDFSKIDSGELELESAPFDLRDEVENCLDVVVTTASAKGLELACSVDDDCPERVSGDVVRLRQIITNLLSNAVKFTDRGEVVVSVGSTPTTGDKLLLEISVHDTGIGIPGDGLAKLFSSFSQVDTSTTRVYGGTGLGLAISRRLAKAMNGELTVASTAGSGSTFTATVELETAPALVVSQVGHATEALAGKSILLVDDNLTNLGILGLQATRLGMSCTSSDDPLKALQLVTDGLRYDVAVLDMRMPSMTGAELGAALRALPGVGTAPHVLLTSLGTRPAGLDESVDSYLTKPVKRGALRDALVTALTGQRSHDRPGAGSRLKASDADPLRLLLAEDNPINQRVEELIFGKLGQKLDIVGNGLEAVEAVEAGDYDAVLMDIQMPQMDGLEATRRIRALPLHQPYIVALTAGVQPADREACVSAGMDDYLAKPVRVHEVRDLLFDITAKLRERAVANGGAPRIPEPQRSV
jgi:PAS domain S-box-containing protein